MGTNSSTFRLSCLATTLSRTLTFREIAAGRLRAWKAGGRNVIPRSEETGRWRNALRRVEPVGGPSRRKYPIGPQ